MVIYKTYDIQKYNTIMGKLFWVLRFEREFGY